MPEVNARRDMFKHGFEKNRHNLVDEDYKLLSERTEGYSGHDISMVIRDSIFQPIRKIQSATHFKKVLIFIIFSKIYNF